MKKLIPIFIALFALLVTSSCVKKDDVYVNPNQTIITGVSSGSWVTKDGGKTYSTSLKMPEIDSYFNDHGAVLVYASFDNGIWEQIPEVYNGIAYSYSHSIGNLEIDIQSSNGSTSITPPGNFRVKIVLVDSN